MTSRPREWSSKKHQETDSHVFLTVALREICQKTPAKAGVTRHGWWQTAMNHPPLVSGQFHHCKPVIACLTHVQLMFILFTPAFHLSHRRIFVKICDMFSAATHGYSWCQRAEQSPPPGMFFASRSGQSSADAVGWKNWRRSWSRCHGIKGPRKQLETWKFWRKASISWKILETGFYLLEVTKL